jgi:hypothetical protein
MNDKLKDFLDPPVGTQYTSVMDSSTKTYPLSPFNSWYMVFVPYATCDAHTGNNTVTYTGSFGRSVKVYHKGMANSLSVIQWIETNFKSPAPEEVFIAGSSAGSIGAITSTPYYMELFKKYSSTTRMTMLGDAGIFRLTEYFEEKALPIWWAKTSSEIPLMWPTFIPSLASGPQSLIYSKTGLIKGFAGMWEKIVPYYYDPNFPTTNPPTRKFAEYTDSSDDVQEYFNYRIHRYDPSDTITQNAAATDWQQDMLSYTSAVSTSNPNYRYYIAPGSDHVILNNNPKIFSLEVPFPNGTRFEDFLRALLTADVRLPIASVSAPSGTLSMFSVTPSTVQAGTVTDVTIAGSGFLTGATVTFKGKSTIAASATGTGAAVTFGDEADIPPTAVVTDMVDEDGDGILDTIYATVTANDEGIWDVVVTQSSSVITQSSSALAQSSSDDDDDDDEDDDDDDEDEDEDEDNGVADSNSLEFSVDDDED